MRNKKCIVFQTRDFMILKHYTQMIQLVDSIQTCNRLVFVLLIYDVLYVHTVVCNINFSTILLNIEVKFDMPLNFIKRCHLNQ